MDIFQIFYNNKNEENAFYMSKYMKNKFSFLADIIGAAILFILGILGEYFGLSYELVSAIDFDPFSNPLAVMVIVFAMLVSALFIFLFNYKITFRELIKDNSVRFKVALTIAIVTMPWTFLLPTKWFY